MPKQTCPCCGEGLLTKKMETVKEEYLGIKGTIELHYIRCKKCLCQFARPQEIERNKTAMKKFKQTAKILSERAKENK